MMKHKVINLSGAVPDNTPIRIEKYDLYQNDVRIGSIEEETLNYLIENRNELQIIKFIEPNVTKEGRCVDIKLFTKLKSELSPMKKFSLIKVIYYSLVMIASLISFVISLFYESSIWVYGFFVATFLSASYLLYEYLKEHGRLPKYVK